MAGTFTQLFIHFVFSTKNRAPLIQPALRDPLYAYVKGIIEGQRGDLIEIGGMPDHMHILTRLHAESSVSEMMRLIKSNSSKWVNELQERIERFEWQGGYGAFTVSRSAKDNVGNYIRHQEKPHRRLTFQEEFLLFLKRHDLSYDPLRIWD